jgi:hypothetical protein
LILSNTFFLLLLLTTDVIRVPNLESLSTVLLLLVTLWLHNTFNTPFLLVLLGLFGTRASYKLLQHMLKKILKVKLYKNSEGTVSDASCDSSAGVEGV